MIDHDVKDKSLAAAGVLRIEWAEKEMPVLALIRERFEKEQPLKGVRIGACLHVTSETASLMRTLRRRALNCRLCASNPLSTQDDVAAAALVVEYGISTFAIKGEDRDTYYGHIKSVIDSKPQITMDDGADVVGLLHTERVDAAAGRHRRDRGDHYWGDPPEVDGKGRRPSLPHHRGQRGYDEAHVRQPLRNGSVYARRHHPRDEPSDRLQDRGDGRIRLVRPRGGHAGQGPRGRRRSCSKSIRSGLSRRQWTVSG